MADSSRRWLSGPLARFAAGFGAGWLLLGVLMLVLRIPPGIWALAAVICFVLGAATLALGYRSLVRIGDGSLHVPGTGALPWDQISSVRLAPMDGGWAPLVEYAEGRALRVVALDGLLGRKPEGRVLAQAQAVAATAGHPLEIVSVQAAHAKPTRAA